MATYIIATDNKSIICMVCGSISYNKFDIENRYCGFCKGFHEDHAAMRQAQRRGELESE